MKKLLKITIALLIVSLFPKTLAFTDTENHWAKSEIDYAVRDQIVCGYDDDTFRPDNEIKVDEFLKMIVVASDKKMVIEGKEWPDWYINTALSYNWIKENEFENYENKITRYEVANILARYIDVSDVINVKSNLTDLDAKNKSIVNKLVSINVINGYGDNTFKGDKTITRAEAVKLINKAVTVRRKLNLDRKYKISNKLSNIGIENVDTYFRNRYEIKNNKLYFYDEGRFARLDGYELDETYINSSKVIKLIKTLINEDGFVSVNYAPDKYTINQLAIKYGDRAGYLYQGSSRFSFTFYEDKPYELRRITGQEKFSEEVFLKINALKLWTSLNQVDDKTYLDDNVLQRFENGIKTVLDEESAREIAKYAKENIVKTHGMGNNKIVDSFEISKYKVDVYAYGSTGLEFYISEK